LSFYSNHFIDKAPSYDRRVADLVRATADPPNRGSMVSFGTTILTDSRRSSVEGAVVGVARTASLSAPVKASLTRGPRLNAGSQEATLSYLVPSPLPSTQPSQISLPPGESPPAIVEFGDRQEIIHPHRFQSYGSPHSAVPLNQSTPFQNYFPTPTMATAYRPAKLPSSPPLPEIPSPPLSRSSSRSKPRRSSVLSTLARAPSRVAKTMSWFRKKPLPPSPPKEKYEKALPDPDDILTRQDLAIRAAINLNVGELPYTSPTPFMHSILNSLSDRTRANRRSVVLDERGLESNTKPGVVSSLVSRRNAVYFILGLFATLAAVIPIAVVFGLRARSAVATTFTCAGGVMTGTFCQLSESHT
jgi:hypothetical protein